MLQVRRLCFAEQLWFSFSDVRKALDDLQKVMKNFESRVEFTEDLQKMSDVSVLLCCNAVP